MGFKVNERLVCIGQNKYCRRTEQTVEHPEIDEEVVVRAVAEDGFISLKGYNYFVYYEPWNFRRLDFDFVEEVIKNVTEETLELEID